MSCYKFLILFAIVKSVMAGGSSTCEPLVSNFNAFFQIFESSLENAENFAISSAEANRVLVPAFNAQLGCIKEMYLNIAANASNRLSGADFSAIKNALSGEIDISSLESIRCISDELSYIKNNLTNIDSSIIPNLSSITQGTTGNAETCFNVYISLLPYIGTTIAFVVEAGTIIAAETASFGTINMADIYLEAMNQANECVFDVLGLGIATILNSDPDGIITYYNGLSTTLEHPYSCIQSIIDYGQNIFNQALTSFNAGAPLNLNIPPVPEFN
ncbi:hypothetical protein ACKWTF_000398 [Chironomus riparius]